MAGEGTKRIIDLTEAAETQSGDYIAIDSTGRGTRKLPAGFMATAEDLSTEQTARQTADATLDGKITTETQARLDADNEIGEQITALDEKTEADAALIQNPTKTLSGALCSFTDGADMPMVACTAEIVPKQSGSGTPSPDNVRPISGWESVTVADYAVNMVTEQTNEKRPCFIKAGTSIVASVKKDGDGNAYFYIYRADGSQIDYWALSGTTGGRSWRTVTLVEDVYYVAFLGQSGTTVSERQIASASRIEYSETLAHTTTTPLGRTVYGGTLDVVSGVLTVDKGYMNYNGSENWAADSNGNRYTIGVADSYREGYTRIQVISNEGAFSSGSSVGTIFLSNTQLYYYPPTSVTSLADFKTWLASNNLQVVYPLATPQTYQLTPTEVSTLLGDNNVWADSGDVEITYRRDISIVINNLESALNG